MGMGRGGGAHGDGDKVVYVTHILHLLFKNQIETDLA